MGEMLFRRPYPSSDTDIPRPGCEYRRYRTAAELPELARPFYETVADVAGIRVESLVAAVFQTEVLLTRWEENRRRREAFGEEGEEFLRMDDGSASDEEMVAE